MNLISTQKRPKAYRKPVMKAAMVAGILTCAVPLAAYAEGPLAATIHVTTLQSYSGSEPLPKPVTILVYDFAVDAENVQVDESQKIRPRHLITGDENPNAVAKQASAKFSEELIARLMKTGIPIKYAAADTADTSNTLSVQGAFVSLRQGDKAERVGIGMGAGSADVQTKVDVHLKTASDAVLLAQFQTETKPAENVGAGVPAAAGVNPAAVAAKSTISDRKKTLNAYAEKTADAMAAAIAKEMAKQGWIKVNEKGEVVQ